MTGGGCSSTPCHLQSNQHRPISVSQIDTLSTWWARPHSQLLPAGGPPPTNDAADHA